MNEISQICEISEQKIAYLEEIFTTWQSHGGYMIAHSTMIKESDMGQIISATINYIKDNHKHLPRLLADLKSSLDVVSRSVSHARGLSLKYPNPAISTPHHRTKRACHHRRVEQQSYPRLHRGDHHLSPPIFLHILLRDEPPRHCRYRQDGALFLGCLRQRDLLGREPHGPVWVQKSASRVGLGG